MYECANCNNEFKKWHGQCPSCKKWNTIEEQTYGKVETTGSILPTSSLENISLDITKRITTNIEPLDLVLGGGLVNGSLTLIGGRPGIGKSTLLLQLAGNLSVNNQVLYVSGEENLGQIKIRANRLMVNSDISFLNEQNIQNMMATATSNNIDVLIIDSVQTSTSSSVSTPNGSVNQLKTIGFELMEYAKSTNTIVILIGHVTKEGDIAGPKLLEHMVDTVIYLENELGNLRTLRSEKNRFGSTNEIGIMEMHTTGLMEYDPNINFATSPGINIGAARSGFPNGNRPIIVEVQALVSSSAYPSPKRSSQGIDISRLNIACALLGKYGNVNLNYDDVYLKLSGGVRARENSIDLGIIASIFSAKLELPIGNDMLFIGEVALTGEIQSTSSDQVLIKAGEKLGYKQIFAGKSYGYQYVTEVKNLQQLFSMIRS